MCKVDRDCDAFYIRIRQDMCTFDLLLELKVLGRFEYILVIYKKNVVVFKIFASVFR